MFKLLLRWSSSYTIMGPCHAVVALPAEAKFLAKS